MRSGGQTCRIITPIVLLVLGAGPQASTPRKSGLWFTAACRVRAESWSWFDASLVNGSYVFGASLLRLGLIGKDWQLRLSGVASTST